MATGSLDAVAGTIRSRLLTYAPPGGAPTLAERLGTTPTGTGADGKLYLDQIPDDVEWPVGLLSIEGLRTEGDDGGFGIRAQAVLTLRGDQRDQTATIRAMGDVASAAWRHWVDRSADGIIVAQALSARAQIPVNEPALREVVIERLVLPFFCYPAYLPEEATTETTS